MSQKLWNTWCVVVLFINTITFYVLVAVTTLPVTTRYISDTKWNKTWQITCLLTEIQSWIIMYLSFLTECKKRHLRKWNVSAFGSFTLRLSFITKRDFRALKNWNIDWIKVTLPVSVFLEASSFVDFVWSFTLLDVTSKINRSKIWIHIQSVC